MTTDLLVGVMVVQTALPHAKNEMQSDGIIREQCTIECKFAFVTNLMLPNHLNSPWVVE